MPDNILVQTWHGTMIVNRHDQHTYANGGKIGVGYQLLQKGAFDQAEIEKLTEILLVLSDIKGAPLTVLDLGANIGCHSLVWGRELGARANIYSVEAQRRLFWMLCGNVALNNLDNVTPINAAVGAETSTMTYFEPDYSKSGSFGSLELRQTEKSENIGQDLSSAKVAQVAMLPISQISPTQPDFIKLDIEGMEYEALTAAEQLLRDAKPVLFYERVKTDAPALVEFLTGLDYRVLTIGMNDLAVPLSHPLNDRLTIETA